MTRYEETEILSNVEDLLSTCRCLIALTKDIDNNPKDFTFLGHLGKKIRLIQTEIIDYLNRN